MHVRKKRRRYKYKYVGINVHTHERERDDVFHRLRSDIHRHVQAAPEPFLFANTTHTLTHRLNAITPGSVDVVGIILVQRKRDKRQNAC